METDLRAVSEAEPGSAPEPHSAALLGGVPENSPSASPVFPDPRRDVRVDTIPPPRIITV